MTDEVQEGVNLDDPDDEELDELPPETEAAEFLGSIQIEAEQDIEAERRN